MCFDKCSAEPDIIEQARPGWVCPECGMARGEDGCDPCLGKLPGVRFACCGHGGKTQSQGYVSFEGGTVIRFDWCSVEKKTADGVCHNPVKSASG